MRGQDLKTLYWRITMSEQITLENGHVISSWNVNRKLTVDGPVFLADVSPPRRIPQGTRVSVMSYQRDASGNFTGRVKVKVQDDSASEDLQDARAFGYEDAFAFRYRGRPRTDGAPHAGYLRANGLPDDDAPEAEAEAGVTEDAPEAEAEAE